LVGGNDYQQSARSTGCDQLGGYSRGSALEGVQRGALARRVGGWGPVGAADGRGLQLRAGHRQRVRAQCGPAELGAGLCDAGGH
ncbi:MAG: hypothetical protein WCO84_08955, partial [bacterium]